jgi:hypothetical protein
MSGAASAADYIPPTPNHYDSQRGIEKLFRDKYEVRLGAFAHGVGGFESGTTSLNAELVFPDPWRGVVADAYRVWLPRPHIGGSVNLNGKTSYAYVGGLWTVPLPHNFFAEAFVGGAIHNGSLQGEPGRAALGCRALFHVGGSLGYRLNERWSVMATFDHLSNGNAVLHGCSNNQGLNEYGVRLGYSF